MRILSIGNSFSAFDVPVTEEERRIAIAAVNETVKAVLP